MKAAASLFAALALCAGQALAQSYPSHPIKVIVPWPPGQATDVAARMFPSALTCAGAAVVIDNRGGRGRRDRLRTAAKSPADGYTLVAGSSGPISISPNVQKGGVRTRSKDFAPISLLAINPFMLV